MRVVPAGPCMLKVVEQPMEIVQSHRQQHNNLDFVPNTVAKVKVSRDSVALERQVQGGGENRLRTPCRPQCCRESRCGQPRPTGSSCWTCATISRSLFGGKSTQRPSHRKVQPGVKKCPTKSRATGLQTQERSLGQRLTFCQVAASLGGEPARKAEELNNRYVCFGEIHSGLMRSRGIQGSFFASDPPSRTRVFRFLCIFPLYFLCPFVFQYFCCPVMA